MHPFLAPDFHIRWSTLTPDHIEPDIRHALDLSKQNIEAICAQDLTIATYASTFLALEQATEVLGRGWGRLQHLDAVNDNPAQREALNKMLPEVSDFYSSIPLNARLWNTLKSVAASPAIATLTPVEQRFVHETLADFRQSGADLPPEQKERIAAIDAELSTLTQQYAEHVLDSTNAWDLVITDEAKLAGLPDSARAAAAASAHAKAAASDGRTPPPATPAWRFTLHAPSMLPVMQHLHDDSIRRQFWEASTKVGAYGTFDNSPLVWQILELRHDKAAILGHRHFADLTLQRRMAKTGRAALDFIENLHARIHPTFLAEHRQLAHYKAAKTQAPEAPLEPWEVAYWAERQRQEIFDFDAESLRPFFPVDGVMAGMFEIASRLFGITIRKVASACIPPGTTPPAAADHAESPVEVWHPECSFYEIHDSDTGSHLGSFHADWHPRESKRGGAWMNSLHLAATGEPHLGLIVGNMSPPVDGMPALITHAEVETIFHEFGHLLHGLLSEVPVKSLAGTNVSWDFVELPSQLMENFCWDRHALDLFARHHESGEPIPDDLLAKMLAARNHLIASAFMRQLALAKLDLELHTRLASFRGKELDALDREILADYRAPLKTDPPSMIRRFNHLFSEPTGYAAGYYSYKWAEVLDADAFTRFQREGILNADTGRAFRQHILSQGNATPPDELYRRFMGRDPQLDPLLIRAGLVLAQPLPTLA
ncbi:MAG: M3 family metallopeptidase [Verrucomicrobia bacterium]|nr:M3 family metallopeptidase [Verrucomicrobiota bacterium]